MSKAAAAIIGTGLVIAFAVLGGQLASALVDFKTWDRVVTVKGLSEREYPADQVIWPTALYASVMKYVLARPSTARVAGWLLWAKAAQTE